MTKARRNAAAVVAAAVLIPTLTGCWSGYGAQTAQQANQPVGNGASMQTGDMQVRGATWVRSTTNPSEATLIATFVNEGDVPDKLTKVEIEPASPMGITGGFLEVPNDGSVRTGHWSTSFINALQLQAFPSQFIPTTFTFERAGTVTGNVLTVPDTGQYFGTPVTVAQQATLQKLAAGADKAGKMGNPGGPDQQDAGVQTPKQFNKNVKKAAAADDQ